MDRKAVAGIILTLILSSMLTLAFNIQQVKAEETIYIRPDGAVYPSTAPISRVGDVYTFFGNVYESIVIERSNIIVDGANYIVQGTFALWSKGLTLSGISNVTIRDVQFKKFYYGIYLSGSSYNSVFRNNITSNYSHGIYLNSSSNNIISENNIGNGGEDIYLFSSSNNIISGNNLTNNWYGIRLHSSSNNTLRNNRMSGNQYNFGVYGLSLYHFIHDVDSSNTVNGKPVCYWVNHQNEMVPTDAAYVALVNSTNITVKNLDLKNNEEGILLAFTKNSTIAGNNITNNNYYGIYLYYSSNNSIYGNNITNNSNYGIYMNYSSNNSIYGNNVTNNYNGIYLLYSSSDNIIHHNNFINNTKQVVSYDSINTWDDGYPSGGNYWSDYSIRYPSVGDDCKGGNQDIPGNDGIWDHPYEVDGLNQDNYPLVNPWTPTSPVITATIDVAPDSLNLRSMGHWITAFIELPEGYNVNDIDVFSIMLNSTIPVDSTGPVTIGDYDSDAVPDLMVKFDRAYVISLIIGEIEIEERFTWVTLKITGNVNDGIPFQGSTTIRIIDIAKDQAKVLRHESYMTL